MKSFKFLSTTVLIFGSSCLCAQIKYDFNSGSYTSGFDPQKKTIKPVKYNSSVTFEIDNINTFRYQVEIAGNNIKYVTQVPSELQAIFRLPTAADTKKTSDALSQSQDAAFTAQKNQADLAARGGGGAPSPIDLAFQAFVKACNDYVDALTNIANLKFRRIELINLSKQDWANQSSLTTAMPADISQVTMEGYLQTFNDAYAKVIKTSLDPNLNSVISQIQPLIDRINAGYHNVNDDNFISLINDISTLQIALRNPKSFTVLSAPIQVTGDFVDFTVTATPAQVSDLYNYISVKSFPIEIPVKHGWKTDFSVGPTVSFGSNSKDDKYYLEPVGTDSVNIKSRENENILSPAIAAMMHFYRPSGTGTSWGGMFGVGAGFQGGNTVNVNIYGGLSIILGKEEKIMISSGVSYLLVDRLKTDQYVADENINYSNTVNLADITEKVFKPSFFLSISYNLTNKVVIQ